MTLQYIRQCKVTITGAGGAIDVSDFRCRFQITHSENSQPIRCVLVVSNLADATEKKLMKEGKKLSLEAGYAGNCSLIFSGEIIQAIRSRDSPTDTTFTVIARDSDLAHTHAVVNKTLAAGHTYRDRVNAVLEAMKPYGVAAGFIADLGSKRFPRAYVMSGMAKDYMRTLSFGTGTSWSIRNGQMQVVKNSSTLSGEAVVLNSHTGMIGRPNQTFGGIEVRMLLNPRVWPGTRLKIDQASINLAQLSTDFTSEGRQTLIPPTDVDGIYKVLYTDTTGDIRGNPWYTDAICVSSSLPIPIQLAGRGIMDPDVQKQDYATKPEGEKSA